MNHKQKLGYMALGAGIMLIGMWVSPLISPPVTAQHNGVFDKIQCREIEVIDKDGKTGITLTTHEERGGGLFVLSGEDGSVDIGTTVRGGFVWVSGKGGSARMMTYKQGGRVSVFGKDGGSAEMATDEVGGRVGVSGKGGSVNIDTNKNGGSVQVYGNILDGKIAGMSIAEQSGVVWVVSGKDYGEGAARMITDEHGGHVEVLNNQLEIRAAMSVNEYDNGAVSTWDRNGDRQ